MPGKEWFERLYARLSVLGLTRTEAHAVLFLAVGAVIGAAMSALRPLWTDASPAGAVSSDTFRRVSVALLGDSMRSADRQDSLMRMLGADTAEVARWRRQEDSLRILLATNAPRDSVRDLIRRLDDDPVGVVNINEANADLLASLPGIGPKLASRIVDHRNQHGPFQKVEDLRRVKGIGKKMFEKIKPFVDIQ